MKKLTQEEFIKKAKILFGNRYSFSEEYKGSKIPILIHCNICGNEFTKRPNDFLMSKDGGCKHYRLKENEKIDFSTFVKKSNEIYNNFFKYVPFEGNKDIKTSTQIICPIHGEFSSIISKHLNGNGCKWCNLKKNEEILSKEREEFKKKSIEKYGDEFNVNYDEYRGASYKIHMKCNKCGYEFKRTPYEHLHENRHCFKCISKQTGWNRIKTTEQYIKECIDKYGDEYGYDKTVYIKSDESVIIKHNTCGRYFSIEANSFLQGHGCPYHLINKSKAEEDICEYIKSLLPDTEIIQNDRNVLNGNELDIFIPSMNIAFEYDGIFWHNENNKPNNYHINKTIACEKKGIRLIHIFEDEWLNNQNIWKSMIKNLLFCEKNHIFARKCILKEISYEESMKFLINNHLQGNCPSSIRYGLYYNGELVSVMTFGTSRHFVGNGKSQYELLRFANKINTVIVGAASKLFKKFINDVNPNNIVSFADRRWSQGHLYDVLGFKLYNKSVPNYYYVIGNERKNRFNFRKSILIKKYGCPIDKTEREFCKSCKFENIPKTNYCSGCGKKNALRNKKSL